MPKTSPPAVSRRLWTIAALALTGSLHVYVLERLFNLSPEPIPLADDPSPWRDSEFTYEFTPEAQPQTVLLDAPPQDAPAVPPTSKPPIRRPRPAMPQAAPSSESNLSEVPTIHASDLLRQIPYTARQSLPSETPRRRILDLTLPPTADNGIIEPERRSAGLGGAPTRGGMAPVGDLANGLLIEQWQQMHHGTHSTDCKSRPQGEPLSSYLGRCKQGL